MKKFISKLSLMVALLSATNVRAQEEAGIGFKAGADFNNISGLHLNKVYKAYFFGGVQAYVNFGKLGLQVEGLLTQTQLSSGDHFYDAFRDFVNSTSGAVQSGELLLTELAFPAMLTYAVTRPLRIEAGVQYSRIINANDKKEYFKNPKDIVKDSYMSALVGLRLQVGGSVQVGLRYLHGIDDLNATEVDERWKTGRFQLGLALNLFRI